MLMVAPVRKELFKEMNAKEKELKGIEKFIKKDLLSQRLLTWITPQEFKQLIVKRTKDTIV